MTDEASDRAGGPGSLAIGIDVGGSGIKAAVVDVECGCLNSERLRVPTPVPSAPEAVIASIGRLVRRLVKSEGLTETTPVGIGLPGVTLDGTLKFAGNIDQAWIDFPVVDRPVGPSAGQVGGPRRVDQGRGRPARCDDRWGSPLLRQPRSGLDRFPRR